MTISTMLITNNPDIAKDAQAAGVARIMVDLEIMGKKARQAGRDTYISNHRKEDVAVIRDVLDQSELIVRINPWHGQSPQEIDHAVANGADWIMLPMITEMAQFNAFIDAVAGRTKSLPLLETAYCAEHVAGIAGHDAVEEVYIGLNDLHLSLGLNYLFDPLAAGVVDRMAGTIMSYRKPFGFGGIATIGSGELPAERILAEHARLGSTRVILSSSFCKDVRISEAGNRRQRLTDAVDLLQHTHDMLLRRAEAQQETEAEQTRALIRTISNTRRVS